MWVSGVWFFWWNAPSDLIYDGFSNLREVSLFPLACSSRHILSIASGKKRCNYLFVSN